MFRKWWFNYVVVFGRRNLIVFCLFVFISRDGYFRFNYLGFGLFGNLLFWIYWKRIDWSKRLLNWCCLKSLIGDMNGIYINNVLKNGMF